MQLRPLHQLILRKHGLPDFFSVCVGTGPKPPLVSTTHVDSRDRTVWYIGGDIADLGTEAGAAIVDEATDKNADIIMLGATLRRQFGFLTIGETVDYVLKHAPCEVIVVRQALPDWITESMEWS